MESLFNKVADYMKGNPITHQPWGPVAADRSFSTSSNPQNCYPSADPLRTLVATCTYDEQSKFKVEQALRATTTMMPHYTTNKLQYIDSNRHKRFIELSGIVEINCGSQAIKIQLYVMLPQYFPRRSPKARFVNISNTPVSNPFYIYMLSKTDGKSYILDTQVRAINKWEQGMEVAKVIFDCQQLLRNQNPFRKDTNLKFNEHLSYQKDPFKSSPQNIHSFNKTYQNGSFYQLNNNVPSSFSQTQHNSSVASQKSIKKPPIPFSNQLKVNTTFNIKNVAQKSLNYVSASKSKLQTLNAKHIESLQKIQRLDILRRCIESDKIRINQVIHSNNDLLDEQAYKQVTIDSILLLQDARSEQILNLVSAVAAREDSILMLQQYFNQRKISYQDFVKFAKKCTQSLFIDRFLIHKCTNQ